tara:strand:- start:1246 stop:1482 length:237 start_codon:yes stop_codon:yes gene_type:complete
MLGGDRREPIQQNEHLAKPMVVFEGAAYLHNVLQSEFKCENLNGGCSMDVTVLIFFARKNSAGSSSEPATDFCGNGRT